MHKGNGEGEAAAAAVGWQLQRQTSTASWIEIGLPGWPNIGCIDWGGRIASAGYEAEVQPRGFVAVADAVAAVVAVVGAACLPDLVRGKAATAPTQTKGASADSWSARSCRNDGG